MDGSKGRKWTVICMEVDDPGGKGGRSKSPKVDGP